MPVAYKPDPASNLNELSEKYDLNGDTILNIIYNATFKSASRNEDFIRQAAIIDAISKEYCSID